MPLAHHDGAGAALELGDRVGEGVPAWGCRDASSHRVRLLEVRELEGRRQVDRRDHRAEGRVLGTPLAAATVRAANPSDIASSSTQRSSAPSNRANGRSLCRTYQTFKRTIRVHAGTVSARRRHGHGAMPAKTCPVGSRAQQGRRPIAEHHGGQSVAQDCVGPAVGSPPWPSVTTACQCRRPCARCGVNASNRVVLSMADRRRPRRHRSCPGAPEVVRPRHRVPRGRPR